MSDLTGTWLGTYWQQETPSRFELSLVQGGIKLRGNILDDNYLGEATLIGEFTGRRITFNKQYLTGSRHTVYYRGIVSEDDNFMQGEWRINRLSGKWQAHRQEDNLSLSLAGRLSQKIPVSARK